LPILSSCGQNSASTGAGLSFAVAVQSHDNSSREVAATAATDICSEYGIDTVVATVKDSSGNQVGTGSWSCSAHTGSMNGLPSGSGFTLQLVGMSGAVKAWTATTPGISLSTGTVADAGTVNLSYIPATYTKAIVTLAATNATGSNQIISYGATVGIPVGVSLSADASTGEPISGVLTKTSNLSSNTYINGKYTAPSGSIPGNINIGAVDAHGFGSGTILTITTIIASDATPPGASSFPVSSVNGYDVNGALITGIGGTVSISYQ